MTRPTCLYLKIVGTAGALRSVSIDTAGFAQIAATGELVEQDSIDRSSANKANRIMQN